LIRVSSIRSGFTPSDPTADQIVGITTIAKLLKTPIDFTVVNDPDGAGRNDSTIQVTIPFYSHTEQHTGYIVEVYGSATFIWPWVQHTYWHTPTTGTGKVEDAEEVDSDVTIDVNLDLHRDILGATLPGTVYVRVKANKEGLEPSDPSITKSVSVADTKLLATPTASLNNTDGDLLIQVQVDPAFLRPVNETGYMIDAVLGTQDFDDLFTDAVRHLVEKYVRLFL